MKRTTPPGPPSSDRSPLRSPTGPRYRSRRSSLRLVVVVALTAITASACSTTTPSGSVTTSSGFGAGSRWLGSFTPAALPALVNSVARVDCLDAKLCWAVGSTLGSAGAPNGAAIIATVDGGARWVSQVVPPTVGSLSGISCSDQRDCTAVGQASQPTDGQAVIVTTVDGGTVWTAEPVPAGIVDLTAVTCRSDHRCVAIGSTTGGTVALGSPTAGAGWTQLGALPAGVVGATAVSCSDDLSCWVTAYTAVDLDHVTGAVATTDDGGSTWSTVATPAGLGYLNGVDCLRGTATGSGALPTTSTVTTPTPASSGGTAAPGTTSTSVAATTTSVAATTTSVGTPVVGAAGVRCVVVGTTANILNGTRTGRGVLLTTDNGGAAWSSQTVSATSASLTDVSCTAIGSCVAVGDSAATAGPAGVVLLSGSPTDPWRRPAVATAPLPLTGVSCVSTAHCVVVGESFSEHLAGG